MPPIAGLSAAIYLSRTITNCVHPLWHLPVPTDDHCVMTLSRKAIDRLERPYARLQFHLFPGRCAATLIFTKSIFTLRACTCLSPERLRVRHTVCGSLSLRQKRDSPERHTMTEFCAVPKAVVPLSCPCLSRSFACDQQLFSCRSSFFCPAEDIVPWVTSQSIWLA